MKIKCTLLVSLLLTTNALMAQENNVQKFKKAFQSEQFQLYGYGQIIAGYSEFPERHQAKLTAQNSIDIARAILFAQGKLGDRNQYGYMLMYDFAGSCLHELYGEWLPLDAFNARLGQYKIPFTIENPMSPTRIETIYFSRSASAMSGSAGDYNQIKADGKVKAGRDAGVQLSGKLFQKDDFFRVEYYTGLFNGTGFNTKDNNAHKDFIATAYYQPIKGLRVGGSIYAGKLYYNADSLDHVRNRWTVGAEYSGKHIYGRSEYIAANDGGLRRKGGYASLVWKFAPDKWEVLGKYDFYDDGHKETQDITAGINYYFARLCRLQFNYIFTDDEKLGKNNAAAMQLQLFF